MGAIVSRVIVGGALCVAVVTGCVSVTGSPTAPGSRARTLRRAALDTGVARRLCQVPDSVIAGGASCTLRNQGLPYHRF